ncbi:Fc.00g032850.m01.CDS01 [Cosmosporella sp. VM-42]
MASRVRSPSPQDTIVVGFSTKVSAAPSLPSASHTPTLPTSTSYSSAFNYSTPLPSRPHPSTVPTSSPQAPPSTRRSRPTTTTLKQVRQELDRDWGGVDQWKPPPSILCPKAGPLSITKEDTRNIHQITKLARARGIPLATLWDEDGCLGKAAATTNNPPRWGPGVSQLAIGFMQGLRSTTHISKQPDKLEEMTGTSKRGRLLKKHQPRPASEEIASTISSTSRVNSDLPSRPSSTPASAIPKSREATPASQTPSKPGPSFEDRQFAPFTLPAKQPILPSQEFDPPFEDPASRRNTPKVATPSRRETIVSAMRDIARTPHSARAPTTPAQPSRSLTSSGGSINTPLTVDSTREVDDVPTSGQLQAKMLNQLSGDLCLSDDVIGCLLSLHNIPSDVTFFDTLFFNLDKELCKLGSLPKNAQGKETGVGVVHHKRPGHWTVLRYQVFPIAKLVVIGHYDPALDLDDERYKRVEATLGPWFKEAFCENPEDPDDPKWTTEFKRLYGPRQEDETSCGVLAVLACWELSHKPELPVSWGTNNPRYLIHRKVNELYTTQTLMSQGGSNGNARIPSPELGSVSMDMTSDHEDEDSMANSNCDSGISLSRESSTHGRDDDLNDTKREKEQGIGDESNGNDDTSRAWDGTHGEKGAKRPRSDSIDAENRRKKARLGVTEYIISQAAKKGFEEMIERMKTISQEYQKAFPDLERIAGLGEPTRQELEKTQRELAMAEDHEDDCVTKFRKLCGELNEAEMDEQETKKDFESLNNVPIKGTDARQKQARKIRGEVRNFYLESQKKTRAISQDTMRARNDSQQAKDKVEALKYDVACAESRVDAALTSTATQQDAKEIEELIAAKLQKRLFGEKNSE